MKIFKSCIKTVICCVRPAYIWRVAQRQQVPAGEVSSVRPAEFRSGEQSNLICIYFRICNFNLRISLWKLYTAVATFPFRKSTGKLQQKWHPVKFKKKAQLSMAVRLPAGFILRRGGAECRWGWYPRPVSFSWKNLEKTSKLCWTKIELFSCSYSKQDKICVRARSGLNIEIPFFAPHFCWPIHYYYPGTNITA